MQLPKYRLVDVSEQPLIDTEAEINSLHDQGYELNAVSQTFMLMVIPTLTKQDEQMAALIDRMSEQQPDTLPPGFPPGGIELP